MRLIVTRPHPDAGPLAALLEARDHEVVVEPLIDIVCRTDVAIDRHGLQAVVATSANGIRALAARDDRAEFAALPLYAVGKASAEAGLAAGFGDVTSADGDLAALAARIREHVDPDAGRLLYVTGSTISGDLAQTLAGDGYDVERAVLYDAVPAQSLSDDARAAVKAGAGVLLFSPRTASVWTRLAGDAGLGAATAELVHFCLSEAVAEKLRLGLSPHAVRAEIAENPDLDSMIGLLDRAA